MPFETLMPVAEHTSEYGSPLAHNVDLVAFQAELWGTLEEMRARYRHFKAPGNWFNTCSAAQPMHNPFIVAHQLFPHS